MSTLLRVLLVEDDDAYARLLDEELRSAGSSVALDRVPTLGQALRAVGERRYDAILLDLALPDSGGLATVDAILDAAASVPVVVLTANESDAAAVAAVQRGAQDYLTKSDTDAAVLARAIRYARERAAFGQQLSEREARFRALVEHSYDAIALVDESGRALYESRSVERVTGYGPEERVGMDLRLFAHPEDMPDLMRRFDECLATPGTAIPVEYRFRHRDGSWRWGEAVLVNHLHDPVVRAVVVNHRDVTERKTAELALRDREEKLRQAHKMEAVGRLAGGVAHDFNNVLTAIFGYADLLLDQFSEGDPRRRDVQEIRRSADRAASLTRQLLAFSRNQILQPRVLSLNDVVQNVRTLLAKLVGDDVMLEIRSAPDLWLVKADPGQMEQVLMNLAANARDAMPEGGRLSIETSNVELTEEDPEDRPGLAPGRYVLVRVGDSGEGIAQDLVRHIFEPFFTTKDVGKGTGLGLSTVYGIVKQTGGGIYVESEPGQGTRFFIYLPPVAP